MSDAEAGARRGWWMRVWQAAPRKRWLAATLAVLLALNLISSLSAFDGPRTFGERLVADLWRISPIDLVADYAERFVGCDPDTAPLRLLDAEDCSHTRFLSLARPFRILLDVVSDASVGLSPAGGLIFVVSSTLALVLSLAVAVLVIAAIEEELFIFSLLLAALLAPVMFSVVIYAMKWIAWLLSSTFGGLIGPLLLVAVVAAVLYKGLSVCKDGRWTTGDPSGEGRA